LDGFLPKMCLAVRPFDRDGPHSRKLCPVIPTSNQDGHQAKNRKRGDETVKKSSPLIHLLVPDKMVFM
jgi:hypothetical protein